MDLIWFNIRGNPLKLPKVLSIRGLPRGIKTVPFFIDEAMFLSKEAIIKGLGTGQSIKLWEGKVIGTFGGLHELLMHLEGVLEARSIVDYLRRGVLAVVIHIMLISLFFVVVLHRYIGEVKVQGNWS